MGGQDAALSGPDGRVGAVGIVRDITEQHLAAESLAASEARYRLIAENASDVVIRSRRAGVISWVSPSITGVLGWSPEEVIGRSPASLIHPDDVSSVVESQQRTLAAGSNRGEAEVRYATRDGNWRWVRVTGKALRDTDGTLIGGIDTLRDIDAEVETHPTRVRSQPRLAYRAADAIPAARAVGRRARGAAPEQFQLQLCTALHRHRRVGHDQRRLHPHRG